MNSPHILLIDAQPSFLEEAENQLELEASLKTLLKAASILSLPVTYTEQSPAVHGSTLASFLRWLPAETKCFEKASFSACKTEDFLSYTTALPASHWVICGLHAHISILQTARDLLKKGHNVTILNDGLGAPSFYQLSTAIAEMRDLGARITCIESLLFEWIENDTHPSYPAILDLCRPRCTACTC